MRDSRKKPIEQAEPLRARKAKLERVSHYVTKDKKPGALLKGIGVGVEQVRRKTGIDILGDAPWGTHFCQFYQTREDLIDILVPYFKTGLENNEFCMWVTSEPLNSEDAKRSLKQAVKNLDGYIKKGQIEILDYSQWYTKTGVFEADKVLHGWVEKHDQALKRGFDGLRLTGNTFWLEKKDWTRFAEYEALINETIGKYKMLAICTYSLERCGASEILDVEHNHQFSLIRWKGSWKILESSDSNQLEARLAEQTMIAEVLERSREEWESTFNAISDWVAMTDLTGRILRSNRAGEDFTGVTLAEIVGQSCCKLVHGSEKHIPGCPLKKMCETGQRETQELQVPDTNQWLMVTVDPVTDEQGKIIGAVHITRNITERKRAEETLKENEERYRSLFENMLNGFAYCKIIVDEKNKPVDFVYLEVNEAFEKLTTLKRKDVVGKKATEAIPGIKEAHPELFDIYGKTALTGKEANFDIYFKPLDIWLSISVYSPQKGYFVAVFENITERKRSEEALRKSEEHYRMLAETMNDGLGQLDENGTYVYVNNKFGEMLGYSPDEMVGRHWTAFFDDDAQKIINEQLTERRKGISKPYELKNTRRDGERIFLRISPQAIFDADNRYMGSISILTDITERKKAEEVIGRLAKFPAENPNPVLRISANGTIIYGNTASLPLLKVWGCRVGRSMPDQWYEFVLDGLSSGESRQTEVACDGRTLSLTFAPVIKANYVNVYGLDVTERKKAENKLHDYQAELKSLASQLTLVEEHERRRFAMELHDRIGQSLIISKLGLDTACDSESSADLAKALNEATKEIEQMIQEVRSLTFELSSPILYELGFETAVADWLNERIRKNHGIATEFEDDGQPKGLDDDTRAVLFRDVRELLTNVVKHAQAKSVKVSIRKVGSRIHVSVEDDGCGFDPAEIAATATKAGGFGLFSIRERLKQLEGNIEIQSAPGRGTRVTLTVPLKQ